MNILEQFLNAIQYRINDAWEHQWASYKGAQVLGCINDYASMNVVFRREDQTVIEMTAVSELKADQNKAYRWTNPDFKDEIHAEAMSRNIDHSLAFDDCQYVDLDVIEDLLEKGQAMLANEKFDPRIQVPIELDDETLLAAMKAAHELDITFNQYMERALLNIISDSQPKNN